VRLIFTLLLVMFAGISSHPLAAKDTPAPKLIVAIAVDQFSADLFNAYRAHYTDGLRRLAGGVVFPQGYQSHAATETCPGHATILTGSRPARTGIIANDWQNPSRPRVDQNGKIGYEAYCAEDPNFPGSSATHYHVSPQFLKVPTLGDRMKIVHPGARIVAVSGKDRAAVMMGGHRADLTLWWDGTAFVSYAGKAADIPAALTAINARSAASIAKPTPVRFPKFCASSARALTVPSHDPIGILSLRKPGNERSWRATPEFDAMTLDTALAARDALRLGEGDTTDVLAISFSAVDYVGHFYGTNGAEMCTQIHALDATLGRLFEALDQMGIKYAVVLTADHGGHDVPERNLMQGLPFAQRVDAGLSASVAGKVIGARLGLSESVLIGRGSFGDFYIAPGLPADKTALVRTLAVAAYRAHPQVAAVLTREELIAAPVPTGSPDEWSLMDRAKASFDPERSGDFIVLLKEYVTPIAGTSMGALATHGSPWGYDRRVPILFWWPGIVPFEQPNAVETVDILPTLASLIDLTVPAAEIDGRCLDVIAGPGNNCR
jgi:predicted AlkP superfamily pyrophosphatase or phosphodiesterase